MKLPTLLRGGVAAALLGAGAVAGAAEVTIAVAANFTDATRQIVPRFEAATGHSAKVSYGSTGKLYAQIENGAPFDVFLAADAKRPKMAVDEGLAVPGSRFTYARGQLVLWSAEPGLVDGPDALTGAHASRIAIANPKTAPYGLAARQVMENLGVWEQVRGKVVRGDSIAQTFQFAVTGNAPLGFVALSQVKALPEGEKGSSWSIPQALYQPIDQQAVLLNRGADNPAAKAYLEFLAGDEARTVIESFGYGTGG